MYQFASILFQMKTLDADPDSGVVVRIDKQFALTNDWRFILAYLITLRQIWVEVVFAIEHRAQVDLGVKRQPGPDSLPDAFLIDDRQHAWHRGIDQRDMAVRLAAKFGRSAGE